MNRSTYYKWPNRSPSAREIENTTIPCILELYSKADKQLGATKINTCRNRDYCINISSTVLSLQSKNVYSDLGFPYSHGNPCHIAYLGIFFVIFFSFYSCFFRQGKAQSASKNPLYIWHSLRNFVFPYNHKILLLQFLSGWCCHNYRHGR